MFKLEDEPIDYQLTVHRNNYDTHFGVGRFEQDCYHILDNPNTPFYDVIKNFINYYGPITMEKWLDEYGSKVA